MKKALVLICFLIAFGCAFGQKISFDSLINVALANRHKAKVIVSPNRDSLFKLLQAKPGYNRRIDLINAIINNGQETSKSGLAYYYKILDWAKKNHDPVSEAVISANLGYNSYMNGENSTGLQILFNALRVAQRLGDNRTLGMVYEDMGLYYLGNNINQYKLYMQKSLHYSTLAKDTAAMCMALMSLGNIYHEQHKPDSGRVFFYNGLHLAVQINNLQQLARSIAFIAGKEKTDSTIIKYLKARLAIATAAKSLLNISHAYDGLADYYLKRHKIDSGLYYAHKAFYYATNTSVAARVRSARLLSLLYDGGNTDSSLKYTKVYAALHDTATNIQKIQDAQNLAFTEQQHQQQILKQHQDDQNKLRFYILSILIGFLLIMALVFWRNNVRSGKINLLLQAQKLQTEQTLTELKVTQAQLIQSEKMASLGQLTAGIAHEIRNPLNFVNNFSEVGIDLLEELKQEVKNGNNAEAINLATGLTQSLEKISHHGKRADSIVKSMMRSRADNTEKEPTDINQLADQYFNLAYQDLRAKDNSFNIIPIKNFAENLPAINVLQQDIGRVLLNLFNNAFYAVRQKQRLGEPDYRPTVEVATKITATGGLEISVKDNGIGISNGIKEKVMQPFFTTKPPGEGTGLGLSLSYDIVVKGHRGKIDINSVEGEGAEFVILLPVNA